MYRLMGLAHAGLYRTYRSLSAERGQGTVEYVALIMLVAGIMAAVITATKGHTDASVMNKIVGKIKTAIDHTNPAN